MFLLHFVCQAQNEQLIPYRIKNKWGYSNTNGKILIPVKYSYANIFQDSLALVKGGGKFYFINLQGDNIFRKKFSNATPFSNEGIAKVIYQKKIFFINKKGEQTTSKSSSYGCGGAIADIEIVTRENNLYGYKFIPFAVGEPRDTLSIPAIYDTIIPFDRKRIAIAKKSAKWGVITYQNEILIAFEYDNIRYENSHFILSKENTDAVLDNERNLLIDFGKYQILSIESDNLFKVKTIKTNKTSYISSKGFEYFIDFPTDTLKGKLMPNGIRLGNQRISH